MNVSLEDVGVSLGERRVFSGASFEVPSGSVAGVIGPNGSGKTTLLKSVAGLLPFDGQIKLGNDQVKLLNCRSLAQLVSYVPQDETWSFGFTVEQVVAMGLLPTRIGYRESKEDLEGARKALERLDCGHLASRNCLMVSAGERQRVLIARAIVQDTPIMLMDEPTANLDPKYTVLLSHLIRELVKGGKAILCSSHDLNLISSISDVVVVVKDQVVTAEPVATGISLSTLQSAFETKFELVKSGDGPPLIVQRL